ncbi:MAG: hypothetical protein JO144_13810 [Actinobacteria bacterium]|nr:hypothetical protein [Actinomycetota bacterium]
MADISRRALLSRALLGTALGAGALLGLTRPVRHKVAVPPPPAPAALTAALARQRQLLAAYDRVLAGQQAQPDFAGLRADIAAHGTALHEVLQRYPGWRLAVTGSASQAAPDSTPSAADPVSQLAEASRAAATATTTACLQWPATEPHAAEVVPLLGSIAACLTSHLQVLR